MVFGKRKRDQISNEPENPILSDNLEETNAADAGGEDEERANEHELHSTSASRSKQGKQDRQGVRPLLDEVAMLNSAAGKNPGGAKLWRCNHCKINFTSTYTRIHTHFFGPEAGKKADIQRCKALMNDRDAYVKLKKKVEEAEGVGVSARLQQSTIIKKQLSILNISPLEVSFGTMAREVVDLKIMRCLCANAIAFNCLRSPQWHEMVQAINQAPKGYKSPSFEKARTSLLDECYRSVEKELSPVKDTWYVHGVSVVSDGWSNCKQDQLINVIAANSRGAMFMYCGVFNGVEKTGQVIGDFLLEAIEKIGPSNVLQVVTDNAKNCIAAGREVQKIHKHIFWSPCVCHTLNLIFKDFADAFSWMKSTYKSGKQIVNFFTNRKYFLALFKANSTRVLLKVAKTRFGSHYIMLKRLFQCRESLETTVVLRSWKDWISKQDVSTKTLGSLVVENIHDDKFWDEVKEIVRITKPIYMLLKFCDGEGPRMGEIYERMDNMLGEIKDIMATSQYKHEFSSMEQIVVTRWDKMTIPLHCLGFAPTPRFYDHIYLETLAPGGFTRRAPNLDKEVVMGCMEAFGKIAENTYEEKQLRDQFAEFQLRKGIYSMPQAQMDAVTMDAIDWWSIYGSQTPELAEVAKKVLSQPISSSSAERAWSTYGHVHSLKRNRLNSSRADKLVYIYTNLRLLFFVTLMVIRMVLSGNRT
ncbi:hypothetical protein V6N13_088410 [Hibiscus sabdariffa]|uniref:Uncharacterized protein n=2 Tax=Hibiscus sabdariffa TaxID=183260 RepID=A0ABR1Z5Y4_9ROSI